VNNFLGPSPRWYKLGIIAFLFVNQLIFFLFSTFMLVWLLVIEFIFTLAMALKCYPLLPGGLLVIEAVAIGMSHPAHVADEIAHNLDVLLLVFMVAGIYFMKQLLLSVFTELLLNMHSKMRLSLAFCVAAALLSAFLDALTVIAVVISVATGFYSIYHNVKSNQADSGGHIGDDSDFSSNEHKQTLEQFRAFLCSLLMHAGIGTALGGVITMVGEPQNLIIAKSAG